MNFGELKEGYEKIGMYLDKSLNFEDHVEKPWIDTATLGRWTYDGVRHVVDEFNRNVRGLDPRPSVEEAIEISDMKLTLEKKSLRLRDILQDKFSNNKLVMGLFHNES